MNILLLGHSRKYCSSTLPRPVPLHAPFQKEAIGLHECGTEQSIMRKRSSLEKIITLGKQKAAGEEEDDMRWTDSMTGHGINSPRELSRATEDRASWTSPFIEFPGVRARSTARNTHTVDHQNMFDDPHDQVLRTYRRGHIHFKDREMMVGRLKTKKKDFFLVQICVAKLSPSAQD